MAFTWPKYGLNMALSWRIHGLNIPVGHTRLLPVGYICPGPTGLCLALLVCAWPCWCVPGRQLCASTMGPLTKLAARVVRHIRGWDEMGFVRTHRSGAIEKSVRCFACLGTLVPCRDTREPILPKMRCLIENLSKTKRLARHTVHEWPTRSRDPRGHTHEQSSRSCDPPGHIPVHEQSIRSRDPPGQKFTDGRA